MLAYARSHGTQVKYAVIKESGPESAKTFTVVVSTDNNTRHAQGAGPTIETAEHNAAGKYLFRYVPTAERLALAATREAQNRPVAAAVGPSLRLPFIADGPPAPREADQGGAMLRNDRLQLLAPLMQRFGIPQSQATSVDTALTHASHRLSSPSAPDNRVLAHLGSHVLDALASYRLATVLLGSAVRDADMRKHVARFLDKKSGFLKRGFQLLNLQQFLLVGPAVKDLSDSMRAEAFQALMGAALIGRSSVVTLTELLPSELQEWLDRSLLHGTPELLAEMRRQSLAQNTQTSEPCREVAQPQESPPDEPQPHARGHPWRDRRAKRAWRKSQSST